MTLRTVRILAGLTLREAARRRVLRQRRALEPISTDAHDQRDDGFHLRAAGESSSMTKIPYGRQDINQADIDAVAQVLRPGIVETLHRHVDVDCESSLCRGRTVVDLWHRTGNEPNTDVGVDVDADGFLELLCGRLASL